MTVRPTFSPSNCFQNVEGTSGETVAGTGAQGGAPILKTASVRGGRPKVGSGRPAGCGRPYHAGQAATLLPPQAHGEPIPDAPW